MDSSGQPAVLSSSGAPPQNRLPPPPIPDHTLLRRIGGGSYGEVWLARCALGRYRAVKIIRRSLFTDDRPFDREFEGVRNFEPLSRQHESQVDILQVGRGEDYFYYVMELADDAAISADAGRGGIHGAVSAPLPDPETYTPKTLKSELAGRGALPPEECLEIALALCTALDYLHGHGLVHRDVKPSNIIFVGGAPKLADPGLVTDIDASHSFVGTEGYIPPEGPGTPQADLYSLGKLLYELSTGKPRGEFPNLPEDWKARGARGGWPELFEVVLTACEPNPSRRYRTARQMRDELTLLQSGKSLRRVRALERRLALARRLALVAAPLLALGVLLDVVMLYERRQVLHEAERADRESSRARAAEVQARRQLCDSLLAQAQARRLNHRAGRRLDSLEALRQAAKIRPSLALRNEAITCLALDDLRLRPERAWCPAPALFGGFDPAYQRYARGETNGDVTVRRLADDRELIRLTGFYPRFWELTFSPDGELLFVASGKERECVEVWRLASQEPVLRLRGRAFRSMDFSADSRYLVVAFEAPGYPIEVQDLMEPRLAAAFGHPELPFQVRLDPAHPHRLLISDSTSKVELWDWAEGRRLREFAHASWVAGIAWQPEGRHFATGCGDDRVWLWDVEKPEPLATLTGHQWAVVSVAFSADGQFLVSRAWDGTIRLWQACSGRELLSHLVPGFSYDFSKTAPWFGCAVAPGQVGVYEVVPAAGYRPLWPDAGQKSRGAACCFSPDSAWLVSWHEDGARLWRVADGRQLALWNQPSRMSFPIFSRQGNQVVTTTTDGLTRWEIHQAGNNGSVEVQTQPPLAAPDAAGEVNLSADGTALAYCSTGRVHVLEWPSGRERASFQPVVPAEFAALNPNGALGATWQRSGANIEIWDVARSNLVRQVATPSRQPGVWAAFSPDGRWLAAGDYGEYDLWRLSDGHLQYRAPREAAGFDAAIAFSPDARMLAVAINRYSVRLLQTSTGRELATLESPESLDVFRACFNADGTRLAVASGLGPIQLWDLRVLRQQLAALKLDWEE